MGSKMATIALACLLPRPASAVIKATGDREGVVRVTCLSPSIHLRPGSILRSAVTVSVFSVLRNKIIQHNIYSSIVPPHPPPNPPMQAVIWRIFEFAAMLWFY